MGYGGCARAENYTEKNYSHFGISFSSPPLPSTPTKLTIRAMFYGSRCSASSPGWDNDTSLSKYHLDEQLVASIQRAAQHPLTPTAEKLFAHLNTLTDAHVSILLKAAAEWIIARYQRAVDNSEKQREQLDEREV